MDDAATRKLQRLMAEAHGAQHGSPAAMALERFNRELAENYMAANAAAEAEEQARLEQEMAEADEHDEHDEDDSETPSHSRRRRKR